jgi:putative ABC transport system substrate-binding protein
MKRRDFLMLAGGGVALPRFGFAQQARTKRLAFIHSVAEADPATAPFIGRLKRGLATQGWADGGNLQIDYRFGANTPEAALSAAKDLLDRRPDVVVTVGNSTQEAAKLTNAVPIVFALLGDPLGLGLVESFSHPGGNLTGFTQIDQGAVAKLVELLRELAPEVKRVAFLVTPPLQSQVVSVFHSTARALGLEPVVVSVSSVAQIGPALAAFARVAGGGLIAGIGGGGTLLLGNRIAVVQEAVGNRLPAVFGNVLFARDGTVTLHIDDFDVIERAGVYAGLILNGAKPADLPVQAPTRMLLSVNLRTARATGLTVPSSILLRADYVIE